MSASELLVHTISRCARLVRRFSGTHWRMNCDVTLQSDECVAASTPLIMGTRSGRLLAEGTILQTGPHVSKQDKLWHAARAAVAYHGSKTMKRRGSEVVPTGATANR